MSKSPVFKHSHTNQHITKHRHKDEEGEDGPYDDTLGQGVGFPRTLVGVHRFLRGAAFVQVRDIVKHFVRHS